MKAIHGGDIYRNPVELDFSVNTNPFGIPKAVKEALNQAVLDCEKYPDIEYEALKEAIADFSGFPEEQILCGNGASELFLAIVHAVEPKKSLLPVPSFFGYERALQAVKGEVCFYPMKEENGYILDADILYELSDDIDLLFLANPNNPIGNRIDAKLLQAIFAQAKQNNITVVVDECFLDFTGEESILTKEKLEEFPNVIIVRAFTKIFAIPGVRLGYLFCADRNLWEQIALQLPEWNVSTFAQLAGCALTKETEYIETTVASIKKEREFLAKGLEQCGIKTLPSKTNYLLCRTSRKLYDELLTKGILIRNCENYRGLKKGYYRIAVKRHDQNERLLKALTESR